MFISLSRTCIQNFSNWHALFLSHFAAVEAWCGTQRVDPQMIHFQLFVSPDAQEPVQAPNNICLVYAAEKKNILGIDPKKIIIPALFHSKAFVLLYKFETSLALLGRLSRFFCYLRGL